MLLRRITQHVKEQNWFAVFVDFFIVVVGVFIGIQVANWNEDRARYKAETLALIELKKEIEHVITLTEAKAKTYKQAEDAGRRSIAFIDSGKSCTDNCWNILVDFMHASQWQSLAVSDSIYKNIREQGFPTNVAIVDAVEVYLAQVAANASTFKVMPFYRSRVRQIISLKAQDFYWKNCWILADGIEKYDLNCPKGISDEESKKLVQQILNDPEIKPHLTEWVGNILSLPFTLGDQNNGAKRAVTIINQELESR